MVTHEYSNIWSCFLQQVWIQFCNYKFLQPCSHFESKNDLLPNSPHCSGSAKDLKIGFKFVYNIFRFCNLLWTIFNDVTQSPPKFTPSPDCQAKIDVVLTTSVQFKRFLLLLILISKRHITDKYFKAIVVVVVVVVYSQIILSETLLNDYKDACYKNEF